MKQILKITLLCSLLLTLATPAVGAASASKTENNASPINKNSTFEVKQVLNYLYELEDEGILSGQHNFLEDPTQYMNKTEAITGKLPAVQGFELGAIMNQSASTLSGQRWKVVNTAIKWSKSGGIVTMMYHQAYPGSALTWGNVQRNTTQAEFNKIITPGTPEYAALIKDIDSIAPSLKDLQTAGVPVLWRPYHEMNGGWFWWGGKDNYAALWDIMYDRLTNYHKLNNLIWVWNPNAPNAWAGAYAKYFPGVDKVDALAVDIYDNDYNQKYHDDLWKLGQGKPIGIGENGMTPSAAVLKNQPKYSWFMTWGEMLETKNTKDRMISLFDNAYVIDKSEIVLPIKVETDNKGQSEQAPIVTTAPTVTPTPTPTPTETPKPTVTPSPTVTPTPIATINPVEDGLIKNGDFEKGISSWGIWNGKTDYSFTKTEKYSGSQSIRIGLNIGGQQNIGYVPGQLYELRAVGKMAKAGTNATVSIKSNTGINKNLVFSSTSYTEVSLQFKAPEQASQWLSAQFYNGSSSEFYLDHVEIVPVSEPSQEVAFLKNGGFENGITSWGIWSGKTDYAIIDNGRTGKALSVGKNIGGQQNIGYEPGQIYELQVYGKVAKDGDNANIVIKSNTGIQETLVFNKSTYTYQSMKFKTPTEANQWLSIQFWNGGTTNFVIDDIKLVKIKS